MVDALLKIKEHLKPNGILIDMHPQDDILPLFVQVGNVTHQVGHIDVESKFAKYRHADRAIDYVLTQQFFALREKREVDYFVYFETAAACRQYLAEEWSSAKLSEESWRQISNLMASDAKFKQIYYAEGLKFCALIPRATSLSADKRPDD